MMHTDSENHKMRRKRREMCRRVFGRTFPVLVACAMISSTLMTHVQVAYAGENAVQTEGKITEESFQTPSGTAEPVPSLLPSSGTPVKNDTTKTETGLTALIPPAAAEQTVPSAAPAAAEQTVPSAAPASADQPAPSVTPAEADQSVPSAAPDAVISPIPSELLQPSDGTGAGNNMEETDIEPSVIQKNIIEFCNWNTDEVREVGFKTQMAEIGLPESLEVLVCPVTEETDEGQTNAEPTDAGQTDTEPVAAGQPDSSVILVPVQWNCDDYESTILGDYIFTADVDESFLAGQDLSVGDDVISPTVTVRVVSAGPVVLESDLGVTVTAENEEIVDPDTSLNVEKEDVPDEVLQELADREENIDYDDLVCQNLDISLEMDGQQVQPDGRVEVAIQIPGEMSPENFGVYHLAEDGTLTKMQGRVEERSYIFETTHFSEYIGASTYANSTTVSTYSALKNAVSNAGSGDTIRITGTLRMSDTLSVNKNLTFSGGILERAGANAGIDVVSGTLTLNGVTLDGKSVSCDKMALVQVETGGNLIIDQNTVIKNHVGYKEGVTGAGVPYEGPPAVHIMGSGTLKSGSIINNKDDAKGTGVRINEYGVFIMEGGLISGNTITDDSQKFGGAGVYNLGSFYLRGGRISDNHVPENIGLGGGVYNASVAKTFIMTGGVIESSNTAFRGSGIYHSAVKEAGVQLHISGNAQVNAEIYLDYNAGVTDKYIYLDSPLNYAITVNPNNYSEGKVIARVSGSVTDSSQIDNILSQSIRKIAVPVQGNGTVWYTYKAGKTISITRTKPDYIKNTVYVDGKNGDDSTGDGSKDNPVQSFEKAKDYLEYNGTIVVINPVIVGDDQTWELPSSVYGNNSKVISNPDSGNPVVVVTPGGILNLGDISIRNPAGETVVVTEGGTLNTTADTSLSGKGGGNGVTKNVPAVSGTLDNLESAGPPYCQSGQAYSMTLTADPGYMLPDTIEVEMGGNALVPGSGYTYDKETGVITIASVTGSVKVTAFANPIPIQLTADSDKIGGYVSFAIQQVEFKVTGGTGDAAVSLQSGTLPQGLALENNQIFGTPTEAGNGTLTILARDANGAEDSVEISVDIQKGKGSIIGKVTDVNDHPIQGVQVTFRKTDGDDGVSGTTVTDENGKYTFAGLPDGKYTVTAEKDGKSKNTYLIISSDGMIVSGVRDIEMEIGGADVAGKITDVNGQGLKGALVTLKDKSGHTQTVQTSTDAEGNYKFSNVPDGDYNITVKYVTGTGPEAAVITAEGELKVSDDGQTVTGSKDAQLQTGGAELTGTVRDVNHRPVEEALVVVTDDTGKEMGRNTTDSSGNYTISNIPDGNYLITFEKDNGQISSSAEIAGNGQTVTGTGEIMLPVGGADVSGTIKDVNSRPVSGAQVTIKGADDKVIGQDTTDADGKFMIPNVPDGTYHMTIESGDETRTQEVVIADYGQSVTGDGELKLPLGGAGISGTVKDVNELPVAGAEVVIRDGSGKELGRDTTDSNGGYTIPNVPDGTHNITAEIGGKTETVQVTVADEGQAVTGDKNVQLPTGGADINGSIQDVNGRPVPGAEVILKDQNGKELGRDTTDEEGKYTISNVPDGIHKITIESGDKTKIKEVVVADHGQTVNGEVQIKTGGAEVSGKVTDVNKQPMEGAEVVIRDGSGNELGRGTTDSNGDYVISNIPDGDHEVIIEKDGKTETGQVKIRDYGSNVDNDDEVKLPIGGAELKGTITDVNGNPVEGANVVVKDDTGNVLGQDTTDRNGKYTITNVPDGNHEVTVDKEGKKQTGSVEIKDKGQTIDGTDDVQLPVGGAEVGGTVTDVNGKPVEGAEVVIKDQKGQELGRDTTDADGQYHISNVPDGSHDLTAKKDGKTETVNVYISQNGQTVEKEQNTKLQVGGASVGGTITDADGKPIEGAWVTVKDKNDTELGRGKTDQNGQYEITNIPDGEHSLTVEKDKKANTSGLKVDGEKVTEVDGRQGVTADVNKNLGAEIGGTVTGDYDQPVSGAQVTVKDGQGKILKTDTTDENGQYRVDDLPDGTITVTITHPKYPEQSFQVAVDGGKADTTGDRQIQKDPQVKTAEDEIRALADPAAGDEAQIRALRDKLAQAKEKYDNLGSKSGQLDDELIRKLDQLIRTVSSLEVKIDSQQAGTQASLKGNPEELIGLAVSPAEIRNSRSIEVVVTILKKEADPTEKQQIQQIADGRITGAYFDISVVKNITWQDGSQQRILVNSVPKELIFTIAIPEEMRNGKDYQVARYHGNSAELLQTTQNGNSLEFRSDKYSTYAIIYTPEKKEVPVVNQGNDNSGGGDSGNRILAAGTADKAPVGTLLILNLAALMAITALFLVRKKSVHNK
ncbi:carboxypeptidase regulatory-like domain-containing protein [Diplocloster hominis]|uniref:carboxypeptidase regulatory-like domain-containing protein n=1 Tax=Diplocloster hominis TaxID=3079010 RepID=UPI0031BB7394